MAAGSIYLGDGSSRGGTWSVDGTSFTGLPGAVPRFDYGLGVFGINDSGVLVGSGFISATTLSRPLIYSNGTTRVLQSVAGYATAVNAAGTAVGIVSDENFISNGRLWKGGKSFPIGTLGGTTTVPYGTNSEARDINDRGQVVGLALANDNTTHGFLRTVNGQLHDLGLLSPVWQNSYAEATAVNERVQVVGRSAVYDRVGNRNSLQATIWSPGRPLANLGTLGTPGDYRFQSEARDINESGTVVGNSRSRLDQIWNHAVVWQDGAIADLNAVTPSLPAGVVLEAAYAINDNGAIVATSCNLPGTQFCEAGATAAPTSFVLMPVP